jgi:hypothetical protein
MVRHLHRMLGAVILGVTSSRRRRPASVVAGVPIETGQRSVLERPLNFDFQFPETVATPGADCRQISAAEHLGALQQVAY